MMRRDWLILGLLIILPLAVFWQTRNFDFVWDDEVNVAANRYLNPVTPENVLRFWQEPYERLYVPLTYTVWAVCAVFASGGNRLDPTVFHSANILFHILSALVVFAILRRLIRHDWAACAGALLFALHPIQVEPVAWTTGMKDILSGFLSLVALWQYLLHALAKVSRATPPADKRKKAELSRGGAIRSEARALYHYIAATAAFILAILAKPSAVVTPVIAMVLDRMVVGRSLKDSARPLLLWLIATLPFIIATKLVQSESDLDFIAPLWARPFVAADTLAFYLYKLFVPLRLAPDYGRLPELVIEGRWGYFTWVVPVAVSILLYFVKSRSWWLASGAIFAIGILPVSGLLPFSFQNTSTVADRYVYLSMLGPALAASWVVSQSRRRLAAIASSLVILLLGIASAVQARHWQNDQTLFSYALKLNPGSWVAYYGLGRSLAKKSETDKAIASFREAARLKPEFTNAHFSLAALLTRKGQYDEAIAAYRQSLSIAPNFVDARLGLTHTLILRGDLSGAVKEFGQALQIDPNRADIYVNLASLQARMGSLAEAAESLNRALRIKPDFAVAHNSLGRILAAQGDLIRATDHFREAVRIDPTFAEAYESLALALAQQGKAEEAMRYSQEAQRLKGARYQSLPPSTSFR